MPFPTQEAVRPILDPIAADLVAVVHGAWSDWLESGHGGTWRCKRSRANFVWEQMIDRAHRAFSEDPFIHIIEGAETMRFLIKDEVLFRFKKADDTGRSSNVATQLAIDFHDHEKDLLGLPEVQRVEVVYKLNRLETAIADVCVVARDSNRVLWEYSLLDAGEAVVPIPLPMPLPERPAGGIVKLRGEKPAERKKRDQ